MGYYLPHGKSVAPQIDPQRPQAPFPASNIGYKFLLQVFNKTMRKLGAQILKGKKVSLVCLLFLFHGNEEETHHGGSIDYLNILKDGKPSAERIYVRNTIFKALGKEGIMGGAVYVEEGFLAWLPPFSVQENGG